MTWDLFDLEGKYLVRVGDSHMNEQEVSSSLFFYCMIGRVVNVVDVPTEPDLFRKIPNLDLSLSWFRGLL